MRTGSFRTLVTKSRLSAHDPVAVIALWLQTGSVKLHIFLIAALSIASSACGSDDASGTSACTLEAIGSDTGADSLRATLRVPPANISGAATRNSGVSVEWSGCDFPLNAFFAKETITSIITNAPTETLTDTRHGVRLVEADMAIWKFTDGSNQPRFFVTAVHNMLPVVAPRNAEEGERYELSQNGS